MYMHGYVYTNNFTLLDLSLNVLKDINKQKCKNQFEISFDYELNSSFVLIVTTHEEYQQGNFSIIVNGPNNVTMKRKGKMFFYFIMMVICLFIYLQIIFHK